MAQYNFHGGFKNRHGEVKVSLILFSFKEDDVHIIYTPHLDLSGYGYTEEEARSCFEDAMEEFFRYTMNKGTFVKILKELGWKVYGKKSRRPMIPASIEELRENNDLLNSIISEKDYTQSIKDVRIPAMA